jgi:hypothetical protein
MSKACEVGCVRRRAFLADYASEAGRSPGQPGFGDELALAAPQAWGVGVGDDVAGVVGDPLGDVVGETEGDGEVEGDGEGELDGEGEGDGEGDGDFEGDGEGDGGDGVAVARIVLDDGLGLGLGLCDGLACAGAAAVVATAMRTRTRSGEEPAGWAPARVTSVT